MKTNIRRLDSLTHNDTAATKLINDNFNALQQGIEDSLSRTGKTPNFMDAELDMNEHRIINLGEPVNDSDLSTKKYVDDTVAAEETRATGVENTLSGRIDGISGTLSSFGNIVTHNVDEFATASQGAKADTAVQPADLATVATTGNYNDLSNKPTIPVVNNSTITLTQGGSTMGSFTLNQAGDATIALNGESGGATWGLITGTLSDQTDLDAAFAAKQDTLVSGTNIKTVNGNSLLGSGDIEISGGSDIICYKGRAEFNANSSAGTIDVSSVVEDGKNYLPIVTVSAANMKLLNSFASYNKTGKYIAVKRDLSVESGATSVVVYCVLVPSTGNYAGFTSGRYLESNYDRYYSKSESDTTFQTLSNLVTSVDSTSTDSQYPSAKLFYDTCGDIETLINAL